MSSFDSDPEALAWARGHVEAVIEKYSNFQKEAEAKGSKDSATRWRTVVFALKREFIGGEGCVIARFDERRPNFKEVLEDVE